MGIQDRLDTIRAAGDALIAAGTPSVEQVDDWCAQLNSATAATWVLASRVSDRLHAAVIAGEVHIDPEWGTGGRASWPWKDPRNPHTVAAYSRAAVARITATQADAEANTALMRTWPTTPVHDRATIDNFLDRFTLSSHDRLVWLSTNPLGGRNVTLVQLLVDRSDSHELVAAFDANYTTVTTELAEYLIERHAYFGRTQLWRALPAHAVADALARARPDDVTCALSYTAEFDPEHARLIGALIDQWDTTLGELADTAARISGT